MAGHNLLNIAAVTVACLTFIFTCLFTSGALGHRLGLFINSTDSIGDKYYLTRYEMDISPAEWTFYVSVLIYGWQSAWLLYGTVCLFRRLPNGDCFYVAFPILPPILYVVFAFSLACNVSWLLIWDRQYLEIALVFIDLMSCTLYICLVVSLRRLNEFGAAMAREKLTRDIWLMRVLVQNGLGMFASWGTVAAMFNFAVVLRYRTGAKAQVGSTISLAIFTMEIFAWWIFDIFVFEKLLRYMFTPYFIVIFSIGGMLGKKWEYPTGTNAIFTILLMVITILLTVIKCILAFYRHRKYPLFELEPKYPAPLINLEMHHLVETRA